MPWITVSHCLLLDDRFQNWFVFTGQKRNKTWLRRKGNYSFSFILYFTKPVFNDTSGPTAWWPPWGSRSDLSGDVWSQQDITEVSGTWESLSFPSQLPLPSLLWCYWPSPKPTDSWHCLLPLPVNPFGHGAEPEAPGTFSWHSVVAFVGWCNAEGQKLLSSTSWLSVKARHEAVTLDGKENCREAWETVSKS